MHAEHVSELECPRCRGHLEVSEAFGWIESGELRCAGCSTEFPIESGVPRLVGAPSSGDAPTRVGARTQAAFGFEWLRYPVTTHEEDRVTFFGLTGVEPAFHETVAFDDFLVEEPGPEILAAASTDRLEGKKVFEAGCGMGKYIRVVSGLGARLAVGLDASDAVERAVEVTERRANVLIVQGDIFHPPLKGGFDFAYSVGVLHHTPAPRRAFDSVASLVRPAGELAVWLYPHSDQFAPYLLEVWHERLLRPMTSRLPHRMLERLCVALGKVTVIKTRLREKGGVLGNGLARTLSSVAVGEHLDPGIAAFLNFDWYSPPFRSRHTDAELAEWFRSAGFTGVRKLPLPVSGIARAGDDSAAPDTAPSD